MKIVDDDTIQAGDLGLVYLATPYSKYPLGMETAFRHAAELAAKLLKMGVAVYSPIAHTHPLATYGNIPAADHDIWLPFDEHMMKASDTLIVAMMDGWYDSIGVRAEINFFQARSKPVYYLDPDTLEIGYHHD